jgi:transposase
MKTFSLKRKEGNNLKRSSYPQDTPVVGIDVSKEKSDFCILDTKNQVCKRGVVQHTFNSINAFLQMLLDISNKLGSKPVCIMEATAHYHRILYKQLVENDYTVIVINPIQSSCIKNIDIRNIKNDKVDAYRLAVLYRTGKLKASNIPTGDVSRLRSLSRFHQIITDDIAEHILRLRSYVDQSFPGFEEVFSKLKGKTPLAVLNKYPTPQAIFDAEEDVLIDLIMTASRRSHDYAVSKCKLLKAASRTALKIGLDRPEDVILIPAEIAIIYQMQDSLDKTDKEIASVIKNNSKLSDQVRLLQTIPGVGKFSSAALVAEIGDIDLFSNAKQLTAFLGLDPSQRQSGKFNGTHVKLSKRGSSNLRRIVNMIAVKNAYKQRNGTYANPVIAQYFEQKCEHKEQKTVMCAVMRKMVHIIFAVLRDNKPFELRTPEQHIQMLQSKNSEHRQPA